MAPRTPRTAGRKKADATPETAADKARARRAARAARAARSETRSPETRSPETRSPEAGAVAVEDAPQVPSQRAASPEPRRPDAPRAVPRGVIRRRRLVAVLVVLLVVATLWVGGLLVLQHSGLATVTSVTVTGNTTVPAAQVLDAAAVPTGGPLTDVDTAAAAERVAALAPVASASVSRSWPHTVAIAVVERAPVATFTAASGPELVDATGAVFVGPAPAGLPRLDLPSAGPGDPATTAALTALGDVPATLRPQVQTVTAAIALPGAPPQVTFGLTDDRQVRWGSSDRGAEKATALVPLLTQPGHVFDVASPELPTIRR
jgi:cell division protein FtsQ